MLSAFALAQPLFEILGKNAEFFAVRGSTSREIVVFALALVVLPPAILLAVEQLVALVSAPAMRALHLVFVVGLAALILLQVTRRFLPGWVAVGLAVALAVAVGVLYLRTRLVPTFLTVLAPAPLVFLLLFLFTTSVSKLVFVEEVAVRTAAVRSSTPVVLLVLDEFNPAGLMDANRRLDAERFPNFAALARQSNWYRDATTVHAHTEKAVPAILTGRLPDPGALPVHADHPRNLFTLLGRRYRMNVLETLTRLCPRTVCSGTAAAQSDEPVGPTRTESLVSDASVVYAHVLLPEELAGRLPAITDTWTNFRGGDETRPRRLARAGASSAPSRQGSVRRSGRRCRSCTRSCRTCRGSTSRRGGAMPTRCAAFRASRTRGGGATAGWSSRATSAICSSSGTPTLRSASCSSGCARRASTTAR